MGISENPMFIDGKEFFHQSKQKFRRQHIHLSRIFGTNDGKYLKPVWDSDFSEVPLYDQAQSAGIRNKKATVVLSGFLNTIVAKQI